MTWLIPAAYNPGKWWACGYKDGRDKSWTLEWLSEKSVTIGAVTLSRLLGRAEHSNLEFITYGLTRPLITSERLWGLAEKTLILPLPPIILSKTVYKGKY